MAPLAVLLVCAIAALAAIFAYVYALSLRADPADEAFAGSTDTPLFPSANTDSAFSNAMNASASGFPSKAGNTLLFDSSHVQIGGWGVNDMSVGAPLKASGAKWITWKVMEDNGNQGNRDGKALRGRSRLNIVSTDGTLAWVRDDSGILKLDRYDRTAHNPNAIARILDQHNRRGSDGHPLLDSDNVKVRFDKLDVTPTSSGLWWKQPDAKDVIFDEYSKNYVSHTYGVVINIQNFNS